MYFDFKASNAREQFFTLVKDYRSAKSGPAFRADMKWPCGDIRYIYDVRIADKIAGMFPQDERAGEEARQAFYGLGSADEDMVAFIYDTVVGSIDKFIDDYRAPC